MPPYKYLPYTPTSKIDCPSCGHKKCFTRFYDTESGEIMPDEFGRCDRENECRYYNHPMHGILVNKGYKPPEEQLPQKWIDKNIVLQTMANNHHNAFLRNLKQKFGDQKVEEAIKKYYIGTSKNNGTAYFFIDHTRLVTSCKVIPYSGFNRNKELPIYYPFKTTEGYYPCLFGMHLIDKNKRLKIVESEKTAFIASIVYPDVVWMSPGGAKNFTASKCNMLKKTGYAHMVDLLPDADEAGRSNVKKWQENLAVFGIQSEVVDLGAEYGKGEDLADLLLL